MPWRDSGSSTGWNQSWKWGTDSFSCHCTNAFPPLPFSSRSAQPWCLVQLILTSGTGWARRGTGSSTKRSCFQWFLQMFLSLIVPSVKVSLDKVASQIREWRRVQCDENKGLFFLIYMLTFGFMMDEERIKDIRTASQYNSPVQTPPCSVESLFFHD